MNNLKHIFHLIPVIGLGFAGIFLYPMWISEGVFQDVYPMVGSAIAIYGGFIGSLVWYLKNKKNL